MESINSFNQPEKFKTKTTKFAHVTPSDINNAMGRHGFKLINLKTGIAKSIERAAHQTTVARYRDESRLTVDKKECLDIIIKVPHLYGAIELNLGIFRFICTNGLVVGNIFDSVKVNHISKHVQQLPEKIEELVSKAANLFNIIQQLKDNQLSIKYEREYLLNAIGLRVPSTNTKTNKLVNVDSAIKSVNMITRNADSGLNYWSIFNRVQENLISNCNNVKYVDLLDVERKEITLKSLHNRQLNTVAIDFNKNLFDLTIETFLTQNKLETMGV